jgi:hypothetical protein
MEDMLMSDRTYYSEEAKVRAKRKTMVAVGEALVAGLVMGAAGGLLASKSTRKQLAKTADSTKDDAMSLGERLIKSAKRTLSHAEDDADDVVSSVRKRFA